MNSVVLDDDNGLSNEGRQALAAYRRLVCRRVLIIAFLVLIVSVAFLLDLATGPAGLGLSEIWASLIGAPEASRAATVIMWQVRLPSALLAMCVGAALSLAGAEMQSILNNPLASPFTLGISSAASFGAALSIAFGLSLPFLPAGFGVPINAFLFAFASVLLLQVMARRSAGDPYVLVLFGIALVFTFNSLLAVAQFLASADALQQFMFWSMGSLARANWQAIAILAAVIAVVLPTSLASSWKMTALRLGDERAAGYGIDIRRLRFVSLMRVSLLAATAVAFVGTIGFVGLVGPHIARMVIGEDHRFFLPASILTGAAMMLLASVLSKLVLSGVVLPVGVVTSLIGLPVFVVLLMRRRIA